MTFPPNLGPKAPERNPTPEPQFYQPSVFNISALSLGTSTTVTTSVNNNYVVGQLVRLLIPRYFGSFQIDEQTGYVTSIPAANQVVININSTQASPFIASPPFGPTPPQIVAVGDVNSGNLSTTGRNSTLTQLSIPGAFINVSPAPTGTFI